MRSSEFSLWLLALSCGLPAQDNALLQHLRCGMSIAEVQMLTDRPLRRTETQQRLGAYKIHTSRSDMWLDFREGHLVAVTEGRMSGLTSLRLSPKKNLCTGNLTFFISLEWEVPLQGSDVFLDGSKIQKGASSGLIFEVSAGEHKLEVIKENYEPVVRYLHLGRADAGRQDILIRSAELHPKRFSGR